MFSSTDNNANDLVSWNVRTIPSRATLYAGTPASSRSSRRQRPWSGLSKPVSRLNSVVLPAPFGPIKAVTAPRWNSRCSTSTATSPPNVRRTASTTRIGSGFREPGSRATPSLHDGASVSAVTDRHLALVAEDSLRTEDHEQDQRRPDEDEADHPDLRAVDEPRRQAVVAVGLPEHVVGELQHTFEDDRADDRAEHPCRASQDQSDIRGQGEARAVVVRQERLIRSCEHPPGQRAEHPSEHQAPHRVPQAGRAKP